MPAAPHITVVLLGPPGAGKGTQATTLSQARSLLHLSTGDLLRQAIAQGTELGRQVKALVEAGRLVPDETVTAVVADRIGRPDAGGGLLFDGFPRTVAQAGMLEALLADLHLQLPVVVELRVPDDAVVERLSARRQCARCGPRPAEDAACSVCGGPLAQRADDRPEVIRERLRVYHEQTAPLSEHYGTLRALRLVDGMGPPEQVARRVARAVELGRGEGAER